MLGKFIHIYIYISIEIYTCTHIYIQTRLHTHICIDKHRYIDACMHIRSRLGRGDTCQNYLKIVATHSDCSVYGLASCHQFTDEGVPG